MGDLAPLEPNREAFKARVAEVYPEAKLGAIPNNAGQLFRFVHEMAVGDLVVYPSKRDTTMTSIRGTRGCFRCGVFMFQSRSTQTTCE
jgi:predicted Mrr-cat superfamily restriction endonuclease